MSKVDTVKRRERRKFPRVDFITESILIADGSDVSIKTRNISKSGLLIDSSAKIEEFAVISIKLTIPTKDKADSVIKCEGVVVRCEKRGHALFPYRIAIHFLLLDDIDSKKITELVAMK